MGGNGGGPARRFPGPSAWSVFRQVLRDGGPGYLQFAITNLCNADCGFCGFARSRFDPRQRRSVTLDEAIEAIDIAHRNGIGYLLFVGGEPLVHRDLAAMIRHAASLGIHPMVCTNGALWTEANLHELADAGLSSVIMSVDAHDAARHESNRGLPDVCRKMRRANEFFRAAGIQTTASVTASRLLEDYGRLPDFLRELGFRGCTFSYPLTELKSSYLSFSEGGLVRFTPEELADVFERIRRLKRESGFAVLNPDASLSEMQRHVRGESQRFPCLGGFKYFYLDWNLDLYRCHYWETPMCPVREWDETRRVRDGCTRCRIDCYRDPSVMQFVAVSVSDAWQALRRGRVLEAAGHLLDRRNAASLRAVWDERSWIREV